MSTQLSKQVVNEFESYWIYLAMAFSFETMNLKVLAGWFYVQADEEKDHAMKIAKYILDQGADVKLDTIPKPKNTYKTAAGICKAALGHEIKITNDINSLVALARKENDFATESFLSWFVDEQVEEVSKAGDLYNLVSMAKSPDQLFMLESRISRTSESDGQ